MVNPFKVAKCDVAAHDERAVVVFYPRIASPGNLDSQCPR